jgi:tRNA-splicing ligase RtcB
MIDMHNFQQLDENLWEIPQTFRADMRVPARIYASSAMLQNILHERAIEQLVNVASLPGVYKFVLAMPDIHQGYGFPIGGVAAIDAAEGVISPGGVGYDINCGVRLLASQYSYAELQPNIVQLINQMQRDVPSGVGRGGNLVLTGKDFDRVLNQGMKWLLKKGYGSEGDCDFVEEQGCFAIADASFVSEKAKKRGADQLGTLGAGNHFLEIQKVAKIYDQKVAQTFGLFAEQIVVMIHTGSRGLGHQICTDYVQQMHKRIGYYKIDLPDRELVCAPFSSEDGQQYYKAMAAAANFAWANRQIIAERVRQAWQHVLSDSTQLRIIYDVAHNIAKLEQYNGRKFIVHRKGATRAFAANHPDLPLQYQKIGQPVIIPGSMGTASYVLVGTQNAMENTFGSACHGAGRCMSRHKAKKTIDYQQLMAELKQKEIIIRGSSAHGLVEEAPAAYKDIENVIQVVDRAKIATKVAKLIPIAVMKG